MRHLSFRVPRIQQAHARRVAPAESVIGTFWGTLRPGDGAATPPGLVVHVIRRARFRRDLARIDPTVLEAATSAFTVTEVARAAQQVLDNRDPVRGDDADRGRSTLTAAAIDDGVAYLLVSGHGTLPLIDGELPWTYQQGEPTARVTAPGEPVGELIEGRLDSTSDYALARVAGSPGSVSAFHHGSDGFAPLVLRRSAVARGEVVRHFSAIREQRVTGSIEQSAIGRIVLPGVGGHLYPYRNVLVAWTGDPELPFSVGGDSGSLVVDVDRRAIGVVIGGDESAGISYILPLTATLQHVGDRARSFFTEESS